MRILGLVGYYWCFIRDFGVINKPLIELLKKDQWQWYPEAESAFNRLKALLATTPILALP